MWMPRYTSAKLPLPMWCRRLNLPMICPSPVAAAEDDDDGDAPDRRGCGVAMVAALAGRPGVFPQCLCSCHQRRGHGLQAAEERQDGRMWCAMRWRRWCCGR
jgi:hypothetical protein